MVGPSNPANPPLSQFDGPEVLRKGFDDSQDAFREEITSSILPLNAAQEAGGNLDKIVALLQSVLIELKTIRACETLNAANLNNLGPDDLDSVLSGFDETL